MLAFALMHFDDPIDSQAECFLNEFSNLPDLHENAFIALMALGLETEEPYRQALNNYQYTLLPSTLRQSGQQFDLPSVPSTLDVKQFWEVKSGFCYLGDELCTEHLLQNRVALEASLSQFEGLLQRFVAVSEFNNFTPLNSVHVFIEYDNYSALSAMVGAKALFLIDEHKFDEAATLINRLAILDRKLLRAKVSLIADMAFTSNYNLLYEPLIQKLLKTKFDNWHLLWQVLQPLSIGEISYNHSLLRQSITFLNSFESELNVDKQQSDLWLGEDKTSYLYKRNITRNYLYKTINSQLLPYDVSKETLLEAITLAQSANGQIQNERKMARGSNWRLLKYFRNIIGYQFVELTLPTPLDFGENLVSVDLEIYLLQALIQAKREGLESVITEPLLKNPYTGEGASFVDNRLCYRFDDDDVCLTMP
ncbi:hypothetical protein AAEU32_11740 [Pseudoalteromonas sp. SSDWG2]|uniref:hypothetical protein n=1 Tax=Pseudoalteromonas sp. SSDWG2 TaxID=3139391 RepID=UPI003BAD2A2B